MYNKYIKRMVSTNRYYSLFLLTFFSVFSLIVFSFDYDAYAIEFDNISPMNIIKEDGTTFEIDPTFIVEEGFKVYNNTDVKDNKISLTRGEPIKVSYKSPCGFADSIKGLLLKGTIDRTISAFSETTTQLENIKLSGEQKEFYENNSPQEEGIEIAGVPEDIPSDIEIAGVPEDNNYKVVLVVVCDDEEIYYTAAAEIN
jgi:antitoxin component YwqK of YwqJK toxin-antitoxin module